jgi:hypothetical protein
MNNYPTIPTITGVPFVDHVDQNAKPTLNVSDLLKKVFSGGLSFGFCEVSSNGYYKLMGYKYNLKPYLKTILVYQYGNWNMYFAPNKTTLRRCLYGRIDKMVYI